MSKLEEHKDKYVPAALAVGIAISLVFTMTVAQNSATPNYVDTTVEDEISTLTTDFNGVIETLNSDISTNTENFNSLNQSFSDLSDSLQDEVSSIQTEQSQLDGEVENNSQTVEELEKENEQLRDKLARIGRIDSSVKNIGESSVTVELVNNRAFTTYDIEVSMRVGDTVFNEEVNELGVSESEELSFAKPGTVNSTKDFNLEVSYDEFGHEEE